MSEHSSRSPSQRIPWWLWLNVLCLDAPLLAVLWQSALAQCHQVKLLPGCYSALALSVWLIYLTDRTMDGFSKGDPDKLSARHLFYRRYRWFFALLVVVVSLALLWETLMDIPSGLLWRGLALGFLVCLYLLHYAAWVSRALYVTGNVLTCAAGGLVLYFLPLPEPYRLLFMTLLGALLLLSLGRSWENGSRLLPKELLCGYLFAVGCSLSVSFFTLDGLTSPFVAVETLMLAVLCILNGIAIACYERQLDAVNDPDAITQTWPLIIRAYPLLLLTLAAVAVTALFKLGSGARPPREMVWYVIAILLSTILLGTLHTFAKRLPPELAHVLADVALVTPALFFLVR